MPLGHCGGLLTLGGMLTYGSGQWKDTVLEEILPVTFPDAFDLKWEKKGAAPEAKGKHPVTENVSWPQDARFFWIHESAPKSGSTVLMEAGSRPMVVLRTCGEGRVATILTTCHGEPVQGQTEAWQSEAWTKLLAQTMRWLKRGK